MIVSVSNFCTIVGLAMVAALGTESFSFLTVSLTDEHTAGTPNLLRSDRLLTIREMTTNLILVFMRFSLVQLKI